MPQFPYTFGSLVAPDDDATTFDPSSVGATSVDTPAPPVNAPDLSSLGQQVDLGAPPVYDPLAEIDKLIGVDRKTFKPIAAPKPTKAAAPKPTQKVEPPKQTDPFADIDALLAGESKPVVSGTDVNGIPTLVPGLSVDGTPTHVPGVNDHQVRPPRPRPVVQPPDLPTALPGMPGDDLETQLQNFSPDVQNAARQLLDVQAQVKSIADTVPPIVWDLAREAAKTGTHPPQAASLPPAVQQVYQRLVALQKQRDQLLGKVPSIVWDLANQQTTPEPTLDTIGTAAANPLVAGYRPGVVPPPPAPPRLGSAKTGGMATEPPPGQGILDAAGNALVTTPIEGVIQAAGAIPTLTRAAVSQPARQTVMARSRTGQLYPSTMAAPPSDETLAAASDVIEGAFKMGTPVAVGAFISDPLLTGAIIAAGTGAQQGVEKGAEAAGATPQQARFMGNLAAILAGGAAHQTIEGVRGARTAAAEARTAEAADAKTRAGAAKTLGVDPDASPEDIKTAYYDLARKNHPDLNPDADATKMADINLAYEWMKDHPSGKTPKQSVSEWVQSQVDWLKSKFQSPEAAAAAGENITTSGRALPGAVVSPPMPSEFTPVGEEASYTGPERRGADRVNTPDADALYAASRADRERAAANFKQTSVAAQENVKMTEQRGTALADVDQVLEEHGADRNARARAEARTASAPFAYDLEEWKAEQRDMGFSAEEVESAVRQSTALGIDPTKSDDLYDLGNYHTGIQQDADWRSTQAALGHVDNPALIEWSRHQGQEAQPPRPELADVDKVLEAHEAPAAKPVEELTDDEIAARVAAKLRAKGHTVGAADAPSTLAATLPSVPNKPTYAKVPFPVADEATLERLPGSVKPSNVDYGKASLERVPLDQLIATQDTVTRSVVEDKLAAPPKELERLPVGTNTRPPRNVPVVVRDTDGKLYLVDGTHTATAAKLRGYTDVQAVVYPMKAEPRPEVADIDKVLEAHGEANPESRYAGEKLYELERATVTEQSDRLAQIQNLENKLVGSQGKTPKNAPALQKQLDALRNEYEGAYEELRSAGGNVGEVRADVEGEPPFVIGERVQWRSPRTQEWVNGVVDSIDTDRRVATMEDGYEVPFKGFDNTGLVGAPTLKEQRAHADTETYEQDMAAQRRRHAEEAGQQRLGLEATPEKKPVTPQLPAAAGSYQLPQFVTAQYAKPTAQAAPTWPARSLELERQVVRAIEQADSATYNDRTEEMNPYRRQAFVANIQGTTSAPGIRKTFIVKPLRMTREGNDLHVTLERLKHSKSGKWTLSGVEKVTLHLPDGASLEGTPGIGVADRYKEKDHAIEEGQQQGNNLGEHQGNAGGRTPAQPSGRGGAAHGAPEQPAREEPQQPRESAPAQEPREVSAPEEEPVVAGGATVSRNALRSSVEVRFPEKPSREVLDQLKRAGFRWAKGNQVWYKKVTPHTAEGIAQNARVITGLAKGFSAPELPRPFDEGKAAFTAGKKRVAPPEFIARGQGPSWYAGWDAANLEAPVPTEGTEIRDLSKVKPGARVEVEGKGVGTVLDPPTTDGGERLRVRLDKKSHPAAQVGALVYPNSGISLVAEEPEETAQRPLEERVKSADKLIEKDAKINLKPLGRGERSQWEVVGKNAIGQTLYQDQRGARSYIENGVRITEPVAMHPTRAGIEMSVDRTGDKAKVWNLAESFEFKYGTPGVAKEAPREEPKTEGEPKSEKRQKLDEERQKLEDEAKGLFDELRKRLGKLNVNFDPDDVILTVKILRNYAKRGIVEFSDAVAKFQEDWGPTARKLDALLEAAWDAFKGQAKSVIDVLGREFSSTQANLPKGVANEFLEMGKKIDPDDLAEDGLEDTPHITVKFGLHTNDIADVRPLLESAKPISVTFGKTSIFPASEAGGADVLKVDVESPELHALNAKLADALETTDTHPEYKPHVTIAYLKRGRGEKYVGDDTMEGQTVLLNHVAFSDKQGTHHEIALTGKEAQNDLSGRGRDDLSGRPGAGSGDTGEPAGGPRNEGAGGLEVQQQGRPEGVPAEPVRGGGRRPPRRVRRPAAGSEVSGAGDASARSGGVHETGDVAAAGVSDDVTVAESRGKAPLHFTIEDAADLTEGGWTSKLDANLDALRLLKTLTAEGRKATADEQRTLAKYIGWGHTNLAPVVDPRAESTLARDPRVQQARQELEKLLTAKELLELGESTANAHYSFNDLPRAMWEIVQKLGFKGGTILEPAVGTGHFFGTMPGEITADKRTKLFGVDKEPIAAAIASHLYQDAFIQASPLQEATVPNDYFDVAISNVPFGRIPVFDPQFVSPERARMTRSVHNYFFAKAIDAVRPGGLVAFITSRYTMDSQDDGVRRYLAERAKLIGAIRLPDASFRKTAGTDVVTDVLVLQKYTPDEAAEAKRQIAYEREYDNASAKARKEMTPPVRQGWITSEPKKVKGPYEGSTNEFHVNEYFHKNKRQVLGEENSSGKMARTSEPQYNVAGEVKLPQLRSAIERMNLSPDTYKPSTAPPRQIATKKPGDAKQGSLVLEKGKLYHYDQGTLVPSDLKGKNLDRAKAFIPLRDAYQSALDVMTGRGSDEDLAKAQTAMKAAYDAFVKTHGHVSKPENARVIELDPNGSRVLALEETEISKEKVGKQTRTVVKVTGLAPIFTKRTVRPVEEPTSADTPHDALVQSLAWKGQVDLPYMAQLTGTPEAQLIDTLKGEIYEDPQSKAWISKDEYLSGDVITKLATADAAVRLDPKYQDNVDALRAVQPVPLGADEFDAPLGATWVPVETYAQFLNEEGKGNVTVKLMNTEQRTQFYVDGYGQHQFLPKGAMFAEWAQEAMNGRLPTIKVKDSDGNERVDPQLTEEARQSLAQLREAWQTWWRSNKTVADNLAQIYNGMFNRDAPRAFDGKHLVLPNASPDVSLRPWQKNVIWRALQSGNTLLAHAVGAGKTYAMVGIAGEMKRLGLARKPMIVVPNNLVEQWRRDFLKMYPDAKVLLPSERDFQKANRQRLIARIANNDWDAVIMAQTQFLRVSVKTETLQRFVEEQVQQLIADGAEQLNMSAEEFENTVTAYGNDDKAAKRAISGRGVPRSVKDIARAILRLRERLQRRLDQQKKDAPITFEQTGSDALLIDEAHLFKNLYFSTGRNNIAGLKGSDAQRSQDMFLKVRLINEASNGRNVHFATGTPISNAMSEMYTMFRYLAQPTLERLGMAGFDSWANAYAVARGEMEPTAEGGYKERIRLRDWSNLRELSKLFRRFSDVILTEDLVKSGVLKLPKLKGGRPTTIAIDPHPDMEAFMAEIAARAEALKGGNVNPKDDNYLKLSSEASLAAIDMRLVHPEAADYPGSRLRVAADEIAKRYREHADKQGTQLAFLDVGTPKGAALAPLPGAATSAPPTSDVDVEEAPEEQDEAAGDIVDEEAEAEQALDYIRGLGSGRDLYSELKRLLVAKGIPADEIAFIHQAKEPADLGKLFQMVREGKVRVLMASTAKGGVGMNVQDRLVALHHLDVPWRPADMEQREGRILRQGNTNPEVEVLRYVTKKSFDEYRWGLLATKQGFIHQFMRGEITTMEDTDPAQLDMQVAQALASGDPRVMRMLNLEREVKGLRARFTNFERRRGQMRSDRQWAESAINFQKETIAQYTPLAAEGEKWQEQARPVSITKGPGTYPGVLQDLRSNASNKQPQTFHLDDKDERKALQDAIAAIIKSEPYSYTPIGKAGPFDLYLDRINEITRVEGGREITEPKYVVTVQVPIPSGFGSHRSPNTIIKAADPWDEKHPPDYRRFLDSATDVERQLAGKIVDAQQRIKNAEKTVADSDEGLAKEFPQTEEMKAKEAELAELKIAVGGERRAQAEAAKEEGEEGETPAETESPMAASPAPGGGVFGNQPPPPRMRRPSSGPPSGKLPEPGGLTTTRRSTDWLGIPNAIRALINPEALGPGARGAAGTIRHEGALSFRALAVANEQLRAFGQRVKDLSREEQVQYWDDAENGRSTGDPDIDAGNQVLRDLTQQFTDELVKLDRLRAEAVRDNYVGRFWQTDPDTMTDFVRRALGRRPIRGAESFRKQRSWDYFTDGLRAIQEAKERIANGTEKEGDARIAKMRPATYNWVESQLAKIAEMQRSIAAERMLRREEASGRAKKVLDSMGKKPPVDENGEDWVRGPDDPALTIYGPKTITIKEAYDPVLMGKLHNFLRQLGVLHIRRVAIGGDRWGFAVGDSKVVSKIGGSEGVIAHELGHILDVRYGLADQWVNDPEMQDELRNLADMREAGQDVDDARKRHIRRGDEKIANLVHAFIYAPEIAKKVAPNAYKALNDLVKEHDELKPLIDIQKHGRSLRLEENEAEQEIPGFPVVGHWYFPKDAAAVWTNHLSKGLRGNPLYDAYMAPAQASTQIMLGFSGFHFTTIAREGLNSRLALSIDALANRGAKVDLGSAARQAVSSPGALAVDAAFGRKIMEEYRAPGTHPEMAPVLDNMMKGGYRGTAESEFWTGERVQKLKDAWEQAVHGETKGRQYWGMAKVPLDALWAGIEVSMKPLMGKYVPWMKTAATYRAVANAMAQMPEGTPLDQQIATYTDIVKEMDFRYGQVVYDNYFMRRIVKDLGQAVFMAPGWTFGTLALAGRGAKQLASIPVKAVRAALGTGKPYPGGLIPMEKNAEGSYQRVPPELVGSSAAYWIGGVLAFMAINGLLTYLHTGEMPHGKDYFGYRDGTLDANGDANRHILPGYEMRDIYGWTHHPVQTALNKLKPVISFFARLAENRTYFGDLIHNPDDSYLRQAWQIAKEAAKETGTPLSYQNFIEALHRDENSVAEAARNFFGITPAKREFVQSDAENLITEYLNRRGRTARTPEEVEASDKRRDFREAVRNADIGKQNEIKASGALSPAQVKNARREGREDYLTYGFKQLTIGESLKVYEAATDDERRELWPLLMKKRHLLMAAPPDQRTALMAEWRDAVALPR